MRNLSLAALALATSGVAMAAPPLDFGEKAEHLLEAQSVKHFGVVKPLKESYNGNIPRADGQRAHRSTSRADSKPISRARTANGPAN